MSFLYFYSSKTLILEMSWTQIESDPGVFTEMIQKFGVKNVQVVDVLGVTKEAFRSIGSPLGFIFLFKWKHNQNFEDGIVLEDKPPNLFFAEQKISNACATQAILNLLLNINDPEIVLGDELTRFKDFSKNFSSDICGETIRNSAVIREVHNSFSRPEPFIMEETVAKEDDDVFHFTTFYPQFDENGEGGIIYELDGLKKGPILHTGFEGTKWLIELVSILQNRINTYGTELRFSLMAVIKDKRFVAKKKIEQLTKELNGMDEKITDKEEKTLTINKQIQELSNLVEEEQSRMEMAYRENERRRFNYIPFFIQLMKGISEKNMFSGLLEKAEEDMKIRLDKKKRKDELKKQMEKKN
ncbi:ubiquitin carboxyl-terminal hydrolase isozyme l5 [Anaeramoeba flamelloides]|uniref:Ubiquitin carboxyl-terminal hydrolase n=1 Tax=Anaeramoeba flamelloides TaxID=1746091 RepID=A0AAV7Z6L4_9EUKA|nr:ubiquitin carboxyl-terminal hydrolase isozyme l5 [Anaeramoeba flamelloides]